MPNLWTKLGFRFEQSSLAFLSGSSGPTFGPYCFRTFPFRSLRSLRRHSSRFIFGGWVARSPARTTQTARATAFRRFRLSPTQWFWGAIAAFFFAATVHVSIVLLFRSVPFPTTVFRHGYDLSFIPTLRLKWLAVVVSATSAGICEETGFRGYMQRPIEQRHGAPISIVLRGRRGHVPRLCHRPGPPRGGSRAVCRYRRCAPGGTGHRLRRCAPHSRPAAFSSR